MREMKSYSIHRDVDTYNELIRGLQGLSADLERRDLVGKRFGEPKEW